MLFVNNDELLGIIRPRYTTSDLDRLCAFLDRYKVLEFPSRSGTGLFPAARDSQFIVHTRYDRSWVRDNVYTAYAHLIAGKLDAARLNVQSLFKMFQSQITRFERIVRGEVDRQDLEGRPYVRFLVQNDGTFVFENWSNAQNDALGYFMWLSSTMVAQAEYQLSLEEFDTLQLFVHFFEAIRFWEDEDFGHWEEPKKIQASSIGAVLAGLRKFTIVCKKVGRGSGASAQKAQKLSAIGSDRLAEILPAECIQTGKERQVDAALLFLIWPLKIVSDAIADTIIANLENKLKGDYGIRRYLGDLFWGPDYDCLNPDDWTADFSSDLSPRQQQVHVSAGVDEAQWCIFDSILSVIFGQRFVSSGGQYNALLQKQVHYFNRALGQITGFDAGEFSVRCPELYYRKGGRYTHNNASPLLWAQSNLLIALDYMRKSLAINHS